MQVRVHNAIDERSVEEDTRLRDFGIRLSSQTNEPNIHPVLSDMDRLSSPFRSKQKPLALVDKVINDTLVLDREGALQVLVRAEVLEVRDIDTVAQSFNCKVSIHLTWLTHGKIRGGSEVTPLTDGAKTVDGEWQPELVFLRSQDEVKDVIPVKLTREEVSYEGQTMTAVHLQRVVQGTFFERLELHSFPIDKQRLHVTCIVSNSPVVRRGGKDCISNGVSLHPKLCDIRFVRAQHCCVLLKGFLQSDAWVVSPDLLVKEGIVQGIADDVPSPLLSLGITVDRRAGFYVWNVFFPIFLMVLLSFSTFFLTLEDLSGHLSVTLTLVLTLAAFKFVVASFVPATSYMTFCDKYVIASFLGLVLVTAQNLIVTIIANTPSSDPDNNPLENIRLSSRVNTISGSIMVGLWVLVNLCLMGIVWLQSRRSRMAGSSGNLKAVRKRDVFKAFTMRHCMETTA